MLAFRGRRLWTAAAGAGGGSGSSWRDGECDGGRTLGTYEAGRVRGCLSECYVSLLGCSCCAAAGVRWEGRMREGGRGASERGLPSARESRRPLSLSDYRRLLGGRRRVDGWKSSAAVSSRATCVPLRVAVGSGAWLRRMRRGGAGRRSLVSNEDPKPLRGTRKGVPSSYTRVRVCGCYSCMLLW